MKRMWIGPEMEGVDVGLTTLFVCSDRSLDASEILSVLLDDESIRRVYFGAGRMGFTGMDRFEWNRLCDWAEKHSVKIIIEITSEQLTNRFVETYDRIPVTFIVSFYNVPTTYNNIQFKTDNDWRVLNYLPSSYTSLKTLQEDNLYSCDKLIAQED